MRVEDIVLPAKGSFLRVVSPWNVRLGHDRDNMHLVARLHLTQEKSGRTCSYPGYFHASSLDVPAGTVLRVREIQTRRSVREEFRDEMWRINFDIKHWGSGPQLLDIPADPAALRVFGDDYFRQMPLTLKTPVIEIPRLECVLLSPREAAALKAGSPYPWEEQARYEDVRGPGASLPRMGPWA